MDIRLGTAPDAWGVWFPDDPRQIPWSRFLDEVAEVGYEWIELGPYGYLPTDPAVLRSELAGRGLKVCACVVEEGLEELSDWPGLEAQVLGAGELAAALGGEFMVLVDGAYFDLNTGAPSGPTRLDEDGWSRMLDTTNRVAEIARDRFGLRLVFHPNAETHVEYEDQIEQLLEDTDPELMGLCVDIGHVAYRGVDPVALIRRHHTRIPHIHLKNFDAAIGRQAQAEELPLARAVDRGLFCELGKGAVDYEAVRDVLREVGYRGYGIVEQDMYPAPFDQPLPIARRSRGYLREIGLG